MPSDIIWKRWLLQPFDLCLSHVLGNLVCENCQRRIFTASGCIYVSRMYSVELALEKWTWINFVKSFNVIKKRVSRRFVSRDHGFCSTNFHAPNRTGLLLCAATDEKVSKSVHCHRLCLECDSPRGIFWSFYRGVRPNEHLARNDRMRATLNDPAPRSSPRNVPRCKRLMDGLVGESWEESGRRAAAQRGTFSDRFYFCRPFTNDGLGRGIWVKCVWIAARASFASCRLICALTCDRDVIFLF